MKSNWVVFKTLRYYVILLNVFYECFLKPKNVTIRLSILHCSLAVSDAMFQSIAHVARRCKASLSPHERHRISQTWVALHTVYTTPHRLPAAPARLLYCNTDHPKMLMHRYTTNHYSNYSSLFSYNTHSVATHPMVTHCNQHSYLASLLRYASSLEMHIPTADALDTNFGEFGGTFGVMHHYGHHVTAIIDGTRSRRRLDLTSASVCQCFLQLRRIKSCVQALSMDVRKTVVNSFVISRVDYCNNLLAAVPRYQLDRLQSLCWIQQHD